MQRRKRRQLQAIGSYRNDEKPRQQTPKQSHSFEAFE
jgi:hypothetical protein